MLKKCPKCKIKKDTIEFSKHKSRYDGLSSWCKHCKSIATKNWRINNKKKSQKNKRTYYKKNLSKIRNNTYIRLYGITLNDYNKMLKEQKLRCYICNKPQSMLKQRLSIDHNHQTGHIRGLLCGYCNGRLLRHLRDNKVRAKGLIKYLTKALIEDNNWE